MLNQIALQGRLVRDVELKRVGNDTALCSFTIATERNDKDRTTDFIDVVCFGATAEFISRNFKKGSMIIVTGSLQSRKWTDKGNNSRISWEVLANHCYFCGSRSEAGDPVKPQTVFYDEDESSGELPF